MKTIYKVYSEMDTAETMRDPSNIIRGDLGVYSTLEKAMARANKLMEETSGWLDSGIKIDSDTGCYACHQIRSYGKSLYIEPQNVI